MEDQQKRHRSSHRTVAWSRADMPIFNCACAEGGSYRGILRAGIGVLREKGVTNFERVGDSAGAIAP